MKELIAVASNYYKTVKSDADDQNEEQAFAELNILCDEPEYSLSNDGNLLRQRKVSEVEIKVDAKRARIMSKHLEEIANKLEELEENQ